MAKSAKVEPVKVRLQVVICPKVAGILEGHAKGLDRSQAWVAGWAISNTLRDPGDFGAWLIRRMKTAAKHQHWTEVRPGGGDIRIQLRLDQQVVTELELVANAWNQSPLKLAGLMIEFAMEAFAHALNALKTNLGMSLRAWVQGPEDAVKYDIDETSESAMNTGAREQDSQKS